MKGWVSGGESTLPVLPTMVELVFLSFLWSAVCICFVCVTRSDSKCVRYLLLRNQSAPKRSSLEGPAFIISRFLWVRNPGVAGLGAYGSRFPTGRHRGVHWGYSQLKALFGKDLLPSSLTWPWQDSVPRGLLD